MKYVPVVRYRQEERAALKRLTLSSKTMPLIEIVTEKPRSNMKKPFAELYAKDLAFLKGPFMVDLPTHLPLSRSTKHNVRDFLLPLKRDRALVVGRLLDLAGIEGLVPVLSYDPVTPYTRGTLVSEAQTLKARFSRLAYRVFSEATNSFLSDLESVAGSDDIVILDINVLPHGSRRLKPLYRRLRSLKAATGCSLVVVRSALSPQLTNVGLVDGQPIIDADDSLRNMYPTYGFDAFGDFAGIKKDVLREGGTVSPGVVYYFWDGGMYVGYKGREPKVSEFACHIVPNLTQSEHWRRMPPRHRALCPGCRYVQDVLAGTESGRGQGMWKRVSMMHYLYTMEERL